MKKFIIILLAIIGFMASGCSRDEELLTNDIPKMSNRCIQAPEVYSDVVFLASDSIITLPDSTSLTLNNINFASMRVSKNLVRTDIIPSEEGDVITRFTYEVNFSLREEINIPLVVIREVVSDTDLQGPSYVPPFQFDISGNFINAEPVIDASQSHSLVHFSLTAEAHTLSGNIGKMDMNVTFYVANVEITITPTIDDWKEP